MDELLDANTALEAEVAARLGLVPNFFRSAQAAPELLEQLWGFAKAGYLDNPMPSVFKERLFIWLSRFCPMRYCIVRHVGFLLGNGHGCPAGDATADTQTIEEVIALLRIPTPWTRDMAPVIANLESTSPGDGHWPESGSSREDAIFACAAVMFVEPARSDSARRALVRALGLREYELFSGFLAFVRTAHYWTMLHPEIESEGDMLELLSGQEELTRLLLEDPEAQRSEMSERMFAELSDLRELNERQELRKAKQALEAKDRQKDQFIAVVAHELRNPLAAIRTAGYALRRIDHVDERVAPLVERIHRHGKSIALMLEDLLDASRIAFGKVSVNLESVEVRSLLVDALDEHEPRASEAQLRLTSDLTHSPCVVNADRIRLRQIIDNLLSNAIKFTPPRGSIEMTLEIVNQSAVISLRDSGIGFESGLAEKLFEPFIQDELGRVRSSGGLGLGLAIAARLAGLQGGSLEAMSPGAGMGATFSLTMPVVSKPRGNSISTELPDLRSRMSVLVVEDNTDLADGVAELLKMHGVRVIVAYDGRSAIQCALDAVPDIILCDLGLPGGMDGYDVARSCRAETSLKHVRLVATSGYSSASDLESARVAGFESLLVKPLTEESLRSLIH